jgi:hypothetical protein
MEMEEKNLAQPEPPQDAVSQIMALFGPQAIVYSTRCSICNSPHIKEINEMCEMKKSPTDVKKFLEEKGVTPPSLSNICHHINEHFKKLAHVATLADYCDQVNGLQQFRQKNYDRLLSMLDMGYVDLANAVGVPTGGDLSKIKEKTDIILKVRKDIRDTISLMNDMESVESQVKAVEMRFVKVFKTKIDNAKSDIEKQTYINALTDFKDLLDALK